MELKEIAAVSGKGGLFKVLKPTKAGVILETLDEKKNKIVASLHNRVSVLDEISIYTYTQEGSTPLIDVFRKMHEEFEDDLGVESSSKPDELKAFFKHIIPDYDVDRVYVSDIKKVISWYKILLKYVPSLITEASEASTDEEKVDQKETEESKGKTDEDSKSVEKSDEE
ncbi:MAG: DUF5606 domain-containing protein [Bacteroidota bacterium]